MPHSESTMSNNTDAAGGELPELPEPYSFIGFSDPKRATEDVYSADQMRAYAREAVRMALSAGAQPAAQEPISDERILHLWDTHVAYETNPNRPKQPPLDDKDKIAFARAVLSAAPHPAPQQPDARDAPIKDRAALESTLRFIEEKVWPRKCDSDGVSGCWRCQSVYLASRMRELLSESASRDALVRELVEAMGKAEKLLTNLQPHIPQACIPGHAAFIDNYVGPALETLRAALSKVPGATS